MLPFYFQVSLNIASSLTDIARRKEGGREVFGDFTEGGREVIGDFIDLIHTRQV